ncbi:nicotinate-nucleotide adenylyltransferase [Thermosulfuriphilus sp.]
MTDRSASKLKVGLLGGTLDPIHLGHLRMAEEVREELGLEKIILIPARLPPHKLKYPLSPYNDRLEMARLAVSDIPYFEVSDIEGRLPPPSYSVRTLEHLCRVFPERSLYFLLGFDAFLEITTWWNYSRLLDYAHLVVVSRGKTTEEEFTAALKRAWSDLRFLSAREFERPGGRRIFFVPVTRLDISSTRIRTLVAQGRSIRFLVSEKVEHYILDRKLYIRRDIKRL